MRPPRSGGGIPALLYTFKQARAAGGFLRFWKALRAKNACKTCALGMGGQRGGMVNESGHFPEVCKKSMQAMTADMRGAIRRGFFEEFTLDQLARFSPRDLETAGRLTQPLIAGPDDRSYRPISWNEALERVSRQLRAARPQETVFYASGRSSNEAGFLYQLLARLHGTNNVNNCSFFCHNASAVALKETLGSSAGTVDLEGLDACDLLFLIGANPASNHPRLLRTIVELKRRGGAVVVVNPIREVGLVNFRVPSDMRSLLFGSSIADDYVQPHIGGDIAFFLGLSKAILEAGAEDRPFLEAHTEAFEEFRSAAASAEWSRLVAQSGVDEATIRAVAARYARAKRAVFAWTMGITHHEHGVANIHAIAGSALLRGMLGKPGAGLLPLRGHSNVQGLGTVGVVPNLAPGFRERLEARFGVELPTEPGLDTLASLQLADQGGVKIMLHLGGNLLGSAPDAAWTSRALGKVDLSVFLSTALNTGHIHGRGRESIILPVQVRDEESQHTTQESMFGYVRLSDGGAARHDGPRSEVDVLATIGERALAGRSPVDVALLRDHAALRSAIAAVIPELAGIERIEATKREFAVPNRIFHSPQFPTPSGRARFHAVRLPELADTDPKAGRFRLMTIRSEGQFNTVVYEEDDFYRGQERRDVILLHPDDIAAMGLKPDDRVRVESSCGAMEGILVRPFDIRRGNAAMYYPEANALVPAVVDARSKTPPFKNVAITVRPSRSLPVMRTAPAARPQPALAKSAKR